MSPCIGDANEACSNSNGFCLSPCLGLSYTHKSTPAIAAFYCAFNAATASCLCPTMRFTNHESLPSLQELFSKFIEAYPQYSDTDQADLIRASEYYHLELCSLACFDYIGHGLFSYSQTQSINTMIPYASSSSSTPPLLHFDVSHKCANFHSQLLNCGQESDDDEFESKIRKRIMGFLNMDEGYYSMVFTANQSSAFKLLADAYPFHSNRNLVVAYDHASEAVDTLIEASVKRGVHVMSAEFSWPNLRIQSAKLRKMLVNKKKRKNRGLFVFPLQSKMTGARYSYLWMSLAQENGWHVLLDASALGPKDMETLGLSLFKPDFLIYSFYKVFGQDPSGFGCLFVKKSSASILKDSTASTNIGMARLHPSTRPLMSHEQFVISDRVKEQIPQLQSQSESSMSHTKSKPNEIEIEDVKQKEPTSSEMMEINDGVESSTCKTIAKESFDIKCSGLDHADTLGLILINNRGRFLINWLVNALMRLQHPSSESRLALVRIYGPKIKFNRGPALAFNIFDWKGSKVDPTLVQKLADRNNISLSCGFLHQICFSAKYDEEKEKNLEKRTCKVGVKGGHKKKERIYSGIPVVTAALGFLSNLEDTYRLWAFVSRFLDADFVEKERWRYTALNQNKVEV